MSTPSQQSSSYFVDAENAAEMARLAREATWTTERIGLVPPGIDLAHASQILDIGCGPGSWVINVAQQFPAASVTGIDVSRLMIDYATHYAQELHLHNALFHVMDARYRLDFPDASFDVINGRLLTGFLSPVSWSSLLTECYRIARSGAFLCSTEFEGVGVTTSPSLTRMNHLFVQAMRARGQTFTAEGEFLGITAVQERLLAQSGFCHTHQRAHMINYSFGAPGHAGMYENLRTVLKLIPPFLLSQGVCTKEEVDMLYERSMKEMQEEDFCAVLSLQTSWGQKLM